MHYRDGSEAQLNDLVVMKQDYGKTGSEVVGVLTGAQSQSNSCNASLLALARRTKSELGWGPWIPMVGQTYDFCVTLNECDKVPSFTPTPPPAVAVE